MASEQGNGRLIAGRYRLEVRLGRGGMGVVWRARDLVLGRQVAVKELNLEDPAGFTDAAGLIDEVGLAAPAGPHGPPGPPGPPAGHDSWQQRDRMLREARTVAQIRHPHVIVVHDVVEHEEHPYIVMELIEGGSLADRLAERGPLPPDEAARLCLALLGALRAAHAAGVLHRDLKPGNVLLEDATGRVVLTDFGIAQVSGASTLTEYGSFVGSPEYTAPERMSGGRTGPESDLWSLGVLLCVALTGESPFRRDSLSGLLHAVVMEDVRPPPGVGPLLPVVRGLLERDPQRRTDAAQAERVLRSYVETGVVPYGGPRRAGPWAAGGQPVVAEPYAPSPFMSSLITRAPGPGRGPARWSPRTGRRGAWLAGALVAVLAGAALAVALLTGGDGGDGRIPGPAESASATAPPGPSATPTVTVSSPGATPTVTVTKPPSEAPSPTRTPTSVPTSVPTSAPTTTPTSTP